VQEPDARSRDRFDLVIAQIIMMGWSRVGDVKIEDRHHVRIDTVDKRVVGIGYESIAILQLVHTRDTGGHQALVENRVWGCIVDDLKREGGVLSQNLCSPRLRM
jgi:hypothetical protein